MGDQEMTRLIDRNGKTLSLPRELLVRVFQWLYMKLKITNHYTATGIEVETELVNWKEGVGYTEE